MATSTYPPPPAYYHLYSSYHSQSEPGTSNEQDGSREQQNRDGRDAPPPPPRPPPPIHGSYTSFGAQYSTEDALPSLEAAGIRQLYPQSDSIDVRSELKSLSRELGLVTLELVDCLVERPSHFSHHVEDISLLLKNIHHLLNSLRPHQARATLIHILELQLELRRSALEDIKRRREGARLILEAAKNEALEKLQESGLEVGEAPSHSHAPLGA